MPQPDTIPERLDAGDEAILAGVTYNETHALLVGVALGTLARRVGDARLTLAFGTALLAPWPVGVGPRTLAREPWWALGGFLVGVVRGD